MRKGIDGSKPRSVLSSTARFLVLALSVAMAACTEDETGATVVIVEFDAEGGIAASAETLTIRILGGPADGMLAQTSEQVFVGPDLQWPMEIRVSPKNDDATRIFQASGVVVDAGGETIGLVRRRYSFIAGQTARVRLLFEDVCKTVGATCSDAETCTAGDCQDATNVLRPEAVGSPGVAGDTGADSAPITGGAGGTGGTGGPGDAGGVGGAGGAGGTGGAGGVGGTGGASGTGGAGGVSGGSGAGPDGGAGMGADAGPPDAGDDAATPACDPPRLMCNDACVASDETACGPSCTVCPVPADNGIATCNAGTCGINCDPGYEESGGSCISNNIYVSTTGDDMNTGSTEDIPVETFARAMMLATAGKTVWFEPGTYVGSFATAIPDGVTIRRNGVGGSVTWDGNDTQTLTFAGSATVNDISMRDFDGLVATSGTQTMSGVVSTSPVNGWAISGSATTTCTGCSISGAPSTSALLTVSGNAHLTIDTSSVSGTYASCGVAWPLIVVQDAADLSLDTTDMMASNFYHSAVWQDAGSTGTINVTDGSMDATCSYYYANYPDTMIVAGTGALNMTGGVQRGAIFHAEPDSNMPVYIRDVEFTGIVGIILFSSSTTTIDLGTNGDPGGNDFGSTAVIGIFADGGGYTINAVGNTWEPNNQGADSSGQMTSADNFSGVWDDLSNHNFSFNVASSIFF